MANFITTSNSHGMRRNLTENERKQEIARISELLACEHLKTDGYSDVHNLNHRVGRNFKFADVAGTKGGVTYYFSVKGRNRFTNLGGINTSYKIGSLKHAENHERKLGVVCKWIAVSIDTEEGIYSCYHGSISELLSDPVGKRRIGMTANATERYEAFAVDAACPHDVSDLRNTLCRPRRNKRAATSVTHSDAEVARLCVAQLQPILARVGIATSPSW